MHSHLDFELGRAGAMEMRREIGRNRLESRLAEARQSNGTLTSLSEKVSLPRMAARTVAVVTALFR